MPNTIVTLNYHKCRPDLCNKGFCAAAPACPLHIIKQEEPFDFPMANPTHCKGCARCVAVCPYKAIELN